MNAKRLFVFLILFIALLGTVAGAAGFWWVNQPNLNDTETVIDIPKGATLSGLAQQWQADGWLRSALALKIAARLSVNGNDIRPGEFVLPEGISNFELLNFLALSLIHI